MRVHLYDTEERLCKVARIKDSEKNTLVVIWNDRVFLYRVWHHTIDYGTWMEFYERPFVKVLKDRTSRKEL